MPDTTTNARAAAPAVNAVCLARPSYHCDLLPTGQPGLIGIGETVYVVLCLGEGPQDGYRIINLGNGSVYDVSLYGDWPACDCADHVYRGRECKHSRALARLHAEGAF